jgi:cystathionine beta-synthase
MTVAAAIRRGKRPLRVYGSALEMIGNTPMVEITHFDTGPCRLFAKIEYFNPGGSIKDRIARSMIDRAAARGDLKPGGTIVESTSGNTGTGLALIGRQKGYKVIICIPDKMSQEKIQAMRALGAEVIVTRTDVAFGDPEHYQTMAKRIAEETPDAFYVDQHRNPDNSLAHEETTGPEIWQQMDGDLDAVVAGIGTAGTLAGIGAFLQKTAPDVELILADPVGSILAEHVETGSHGKPAGWIVEGIGEDVMPPLIDLEMVSRGYYVEDKESLLTARELMLKEGIFGGSSTGTLLAAALRYCREQTGPKRVVVIVPDGGDKYLSKMYNRYWMLDQGFVERETFGDLRDLISRRHSDHEDYVVKPDDTLLTAYGRMKQFNVSQLPVMDKKRIVGLVDESDLLREVCIAEDRYSEPVRVAMSTNLQTLAPSDPVERVLEVLESGHVALIAEGDTYYGLVTRIDFLNHLRRQERS